MKTWHLIALAGAGALLLAATRKKQPEMVITEEDVAKWEADNPEHGPPLPDNYDPSNPLT